MASNIATCIIARARVEEAFGPCSSQPMVTPRAAQSVTTSAATGAGSARPDPSATHSANAEVVLFLSMSSSGQSGRAGCLAPALQTGEDAEAVVSCLEGFLTPT